jgi:hypothetical protein
MKEAAIRVNKTRVGKESPAMENLPEPDTARDHAVRCLGIKDAEKEALAYTPSPFSLLTSLRYDIHARALRICLLI